MWPLIYPAPARADPRAPLDDRVRQLAAARRARVAAARPSSRSTRGVVPAGRRARARAPRLDRAPPAARDRGGAQGRPAARDRRDLVARARHRHGRGRSRAAGRVAGRGRRAACSGSAAPATTSAAPASAGSSRSSAATCSRPTVVARGMLDGDVEAIRVPDSALDVLAQQIVAMVGVEPWPVAELERVIRRAASYRELSRAALVGVLDMLAGRYPVRRVRRAAAAPDLGSPGRRADRPQGRAPAQSVVSGGTIPDRGLYGVHLGADRPARRRARRGDGRREPQGRDVHPRRVDLAHRGHHARSRDRVARRPASPARCRSGAATGRAARSSSAARSARSAASSTAGSRRSATPRARGSRASTGSTRSPPRTSSQYLADQRAQTGSGADRSRDHDRALPRRARRLARLHPVAVRQPRPRAVGARARAPARGSARLPGASAVDRRRHRAALRRRRRCCRPTTSCSPIPTTSSASLVDELARSSVFASHFRENAARALLLPRRRPGQRTPLWAQRLRAQQLMGVALRFPAFPITLETYREVLRDVFDCRRCSTCCAQIRARAIRDRAGGHRGARRRSRARWCSTTSRRSCTRATRRSPSARRRR